MCYTLDSGCYPDGTYDMDLNGNCHCNQGFTGDSCNEFCTEGTFGIPPNCYGNIFIQPKTVQGILAITRRCLKIANNQLEFTWTTQNKSELDVKFITFTFLETQCLLKFKPF